MHNVPCDGNPGYQRIIAIVRGQYFWPKMKKYVANYIEKYMECQKVKNEHIHPT
jgi:hypothetical protein